MHTEAIREKTSQKNRYQTGKVQAEQRKNKHKKSKESKEANRNRQQGATSLTLLQSGGRKNSLKWKMSQG